MNLEKQISELEIQNQIDYNRLNIRSHSNQKTKSIILNCSQLDEEIDKIKKEIGLDDSNLNNLSVKYSDEPLNFTLLRATITDGIGEKHLTSRSFHKEVSKISDKCNEENFDENKKSSLCLEDLASNTSFCLPKNSNYQRKVYKKALNASNKTREILGISKIDKTSQPQTIEEKIASFHYPKPVHKNSSHLNFMGQTIYELHGVPEHISRIQRGRVHKRTSQPKKEAIILPNPPIFSTSAYEMADIMIPEIDELLKNHHQ